MRVRGKTDGGATLFLTRTELQVTYDALRYAFETGTPTVRESSILETLSRAIRNANGTVVR
jgi:hypothetical protein